jgi:hypothetical protein
VKESVRIFRVRIAKEALGALYAAKSPKGISEVFVPSRGASNAEKAVAQDRRWQVDVFNVLSNRGVLTGTPAAVVVTDRAKLSEIIVNYEDGDSKLISDILFEDDDRVDALDQIGAAADESSAESSDEDGVGVLKTLVEQISTNHKRFDGAIGTLNEVTRALGHSVEKLLEQTVIGTRAINNRIDKLEERVAAEQRVVEAMQGTLKTASSALVEINASAHAMAGVSSLVQSAADTLIKVSAELDREGADKVGKLTRALNAHLEEGKVLHEALLDVAAERKPS